MSNTHLACSKYLLIKWILKSSFLVINLFLQVESFMVPFHKQSYYYQVFHDQTSSSITCEKHLDILKTALGVPHHLRKVGCVCLDDNRAPVFNLSPLLLSKRATFTQSQHSSMTLSCPRGFTALKNKSRKRKERWCQSPYLSEKNQRFLNLIYFPSPWQQLFLLLYVPQDKETIHLHSSFHLFTSEICMLHFPPLQVHLHLFSL